MNLNVAVFSKFTLITSPSLTT